MTIKTPLGALRFACASGHIDHGVTISKEGLANASIKDALPRSEIEAAFKQAGGFDYKGLKLDASSYTDGNGFYATHSVLVNGASHVAYVKTFGLCYIEHILEIMLLKNYLSKQGVSSSQKYGIKKHINNLEQALESLGNYSALIMNIGSDALVPYEDSALVLCRNPLLPIYGGEVKKVTITSDPLNLLSFKIENDVDGMIQKEIDKYRLPASTLTTSSVVPIVIRSRGERVISGDKRLIAFMYDHRTLLMPAVSILDNLFFNVADRTVDRYETNGISLRYSLENLFSIRQKLESFTFSRSDVFLTFGDILAAVYDDDTYEGLELNDIKTIKVLDGIEYTSVSALCAIYLGIRKSDDFKESPISKLSTAQVKQAVETMVVLVAIMNRSVKMSKSNLVFIDTDELARREYPCLAVK